MFIAFIFIVVGIVFLLKNIGVTDFSWDVIWPLLLVGFGTYIAISVHRVSEKWDRLWEKIFGKPRNKK